MTDYVALGDKYRKDGNIYKAYLCYEQAEFINAVQNGQCDGHYDGLSAECCRLDQKENSNTEEHSKKPPRTAIIILSYNTIAYTRQCLESISKYCAPSSFELIVIDNASSDGSAEWLEGFREKWNSDKINFPMKLQLNTDNVGFPAGCNQGIRLAEPDSDIFLLNSDTIIMENSLFTLRMGLYDNEMTGAVGAVSNSISYHQMIHEKFNILDEYFDYAKQNNKPDEDRHEQRIFLVGFALLIKRKVLKLTGLLDEEFTPGNYEDNDLCFKMIKAGYQLLLCKDSFIYHYGGTSFKKKPEAYQKLLEHNAGLFEQKWGFPCRKASNLHIEVLELIQCESDKPVKILEIGSRCGANLMYLKSRYKLAELTGIEKSASMVSITKNMYKTILLENDELLYYNDIRTNYYDYILLDNSLGCFEDTKTLLSKIKTFLKKEGSLVLSIPNLLHPSVLMMLLQGRFTYSDNGGILDRSQLRFFTLKDITELLEHTGYSISEISATQVNLSSGVKNIIDYLRGIEGTASKEEFLAYQYLIRTRQK